MSKTPTGAWNSEPDPDAYAALGEFVYRFSGLDSSLDRGIGYMFELNTTQVQCVAKNMKFPDKLNALSSAANLVPRSIEPTMLAHFVNHITKPLQAATDRARALNDIRNDLMHSFLVIKDDGSINPIKQAARQKITFKLKS